MGLRSNAWIMSRGGLLRRNLPRLRDAQSSEQGDADLCVAKPPQLSFDVGFRILCRRWD